MSDGDPAPLERHKTFPVVSAQLITALDEAFPNRCPRLDEPSPLIWYHAGQASVVSLLRQIRAEQQEQ